LCRWFEPAKRILFQEIPGGYSPNKPESEFHYLDTLLRYFEKPAVIIRPGDEINKWSLVGTPSNYWFSFNGRGKLP